MNTKIFISFSSEDRNKLNSLTTALKKSTKKFRPIIIDKREDPGKPLTDKVKDGIQETPFFISILTRSSFKNQWVNQELGYAVANDRNIYTVVERSIRDDLKGFIHNQIDLPFIFDGNLLSPHKEGQSFAVCYRKLIRHLEEFTFKASIKPKKIKEGDNYTTNIAFTGRVKNAFFTNHVEHLDSKWFLWHWDAKYLKDGKATTPGELRGSVNIKSKFSFSTAAWPIGKYKIHTRVYEHPTPGELRRFILFEKTNDIEVIKRND